MTKLNAANTRAITEAVCGVACYEGAVASDATGDHFEGTHCGVVMDWPDGEAWLRGEQPASFMTVYPPDSSQEAANDL